MPRITQLLHRILARFLKQDYCDCGCGERFFRYRLITIKTGLPGRPVERVHPDHYKTVWGRSYDG